MKKRIIIITMSVVLSIVLIAVAIRIVIYLGQASYMDADRDTIIDFYDQNKELFSSIKDDAWSIDGFYSSYVIGIVTFDDINRNNVNIDNQQLKDNVKQYFEIAKAPSPSIYRLVLDLRNRNAGKFTYDEFRFDFYYGRNDVNAGIAYIEDYEDRYGKYFNQTDKDYFIKIEDSWYFYCFGSHV